MEYLESDHWHRLRAKAIDRDKCCLRCGSKTRLQAHHKIYRASWFDTLLSDLETLCRRCHKDHHGIAPWGSEVPDIDDDDIPEHAFVNPVEQPAITEFRTFQELESARSRRQITREEYLKLKRVFREQGVMVLPKKIRKRVKEVSSNRKPKWHYQRWQEKGRITRWKNKGASSN